MRLRDAGLRRRQTKLLYPDHRIPPWLIADSARDRSNRLLDPCDMSAIVVAHDKSDKRRDSIGHHAPPFQTDPANLAPFGWGFHRNAGIGKAV